MGKFFIGGSGYGQNGRYFGQHRPAQEQNLRFPLSTLTTHGLGKDRITTSTDQTSPSTPAWIATYNIENHQGSIVLNNLVKAFILKILGFHDFQFPKNSHAS